MSIVEQTPLGWLLDHRDFLILHIKTNKQIEDPGKSGLRNSSLCTDERLQSAETNPESDSDSMGNGTYCCGHKENPRTYKLKRELFNIVSPFRMDSQCSVQTHHSIADNIPTTCKRNRKKKRKKPLNIGEELAAKYHIQIKDTLQAAYRCLIEAGTQKGYLRAAPLVIQADNNLAARSAANSPGLVDMFGQTCWEYRQIQSDIHSIPDHGFTVSSCKDSCNRIYRNPHDTSTVMTVESQDYFIPPHSTFIMSDLSVLNRLSKDMGKFDFIVMDPPWLNKSVKRKKTYFNLQNDMLLNIPLDCLMNNDCIVVVWVTNRRKHIDFVKEELFTKYNIAYIATWYWLKITKYGEMVYDINSEHKKPYETLIIGQYQSTEGHHIDVEENKVIVSVPCSLHSKKPPLYEILKDSLPEESPSCLELFARNLLPNWTSWGNEVLLHQHKEFYEEIT